MWNLGHGEKDFPAKYQEGFKEPERGLPYDNWMRVSEDNRRPMGSTGTNQGTAFQVSSLLSVPTYGKMGPIYLHSGRQENNLRGGRRTGIRM